MKAIQDLYDEYYDPKISSKWNNQVGKTHDNQLDSEQNSIEISLLHIAEGVDLQYPYHFGHAISITLQLHDACGHWKGESCLQLLL